MTTAEVPSVRGHAVVRMSDGWGCSCGTFFHSSRDTARKIANGHRSDLIEAGLPRLIADAWNTKIKPSLRVTSVGCWEFTGAILGTGYGQVWVDKHRAAHRVVAAQFLGLDLNDSQTFVCHRCDNPPCCNPSHLMLGTSSDNTLDAIAKGRRPSLPPNALPKEMCAKGHSMAVTRRPKSKSGGSECSVCRRERRANYYRKRKAERS